MSGNIIPVLWHHILEDPNSQHTILV